VPESSIQLESHGHTAFRSTCTFIAKRLGAYRPVRSSQPLYVSRTALTKGVYLYDGEVKIEQYFVKRGARVIHPESMSLAEQYSAFNSHDRIFGLVGSSMHNLAFAEGVK